MKTLKDYINESLLDLDDLEISVDDVKESVKKFLKENYIGDFIISNRPNKEGKFEVSSNVDVIVSNKTIKYLTNDSFKFTTINGYFDCYNCKSLESLEGAPEKVRGDFECTCCSSLKSLEGAPKEVGGDFSCSTCNSLTSLKGAPKKIGGYFYCNYCKSLTSLKGAPKEVGGHFNCYNCKTSFTKEDVKKYSNVKGIIYI
jgi:hypothetical protein